MNNLD
jgi:hypothetical protein